MSSSNFGSFAGDIKKFTSRDELLDCLILDEKINSLRPQGKIVAIDREESVLLNEEHEGIMFRKRTSKSQNIWRQLIKPVKPEEGYSPLPQ
jgi:hypothetical protein